MKTTIKIKTVREIEVDRIIDLLCCALEGGSNYWYCEINPLNNAPLKSYDDLNFFYRSLIDHGFTIKDQETDKKFTVKPAKIEQALQLMSDDYAKHFNNFISENEDAETGDVFLQLCVFDKVMFS